MRCERCGKEHDGSFGSGRFCSRACANTRTLSKETKDKISKSLNGKIRNTEINRTIRYCRKCGKQLDIRNISGYCANCLRHEPISDKQKRKQSETMKAKGYPLWNLKRNEPSYAEKFFMTVLKNNNISYKFNHTVKNNKNHFYILDFYIEAIDSKIDLEIDGKQHEWEIRKEHDKERDEFLTQQDYIVYRIPWNEINSEQGKQLMKNKVNQFLDFYNKNCGMMQW